jgi:hypothetical protein
MDSSISLQYRKDVFRKDVFSLWTAFHAPQAGLHHTKPMGQMLNENL